MSVVKGEKSLTSDARACNKAAEGTVRRRAIAIGRCSSSPVKLTAICLEAKSNVATRDDQQTCPMFCEEV
jgi:hypothetical protein